jgi:hypothetical protein
VTPSALLALVSEACALAARCADGDAAVLLALSDDGRIICSPEDAADSSIVAFVSDHQRIDKGFGPARSDWVLPPDSRELQQRLIDGWAQAAAEIAPTQAATIDGWRSRGLAHVAANRSHVIVGHEDLAAWLPSGRTWRVAFSPATRP